MTWNSKSQRWFKKFDRKQYAVSCKELRSNYPHLIQSDTKEGSFRAANQWWTDKQKSLTIHPHEAEISSALEIRQKLAQWCILEAREDLRALIISECDQLRNALKSNTALRAESRPKCVGQAAQKLLRAGESVFEDHYFLGELALSPFSVGAYLGEPTDTWKARLETVQQHHVWNSQQPKRLTLEQAVEMFLNNQQSSASRVANLHR